MTNELQQAEEQKAAELLANGWEKLEPLVGFTGFVGPYWCRYDGEQPTMGLIVGERHTNAHLGSIHGGVVMTFADIALGFAMTRLLGEKRMNCVTVSLNTQFVSVAKPGEFVTVSPHVVRQTRSLIFIRGLIQVGDKTIASCEGIWKLLDGELRRA